MLLDPNVKQQISAVLQELAQDILVEDESTVEQDWEGIKTSTRKGQKKY